MIPMRMSSTGPRIEPEGLTSLENEIGAVLPAEYRAFLAEYNGGQPEPRTFRVPTHQEKAFDVQILFGLSRTLESSNLIWNFGQYRSRLGEDLLPIGATDTNDLVLLALEGDRRGRILFWDSMEGAPEEALHEVSHSFREFLDSLSDIDEP